MVEKCSYGFENCTEYKPLNYDIYERLKQQRKTHGTEDDESRKQCLDGVLQDITDEICRSSYNCIFAEAVMRQYGTFEKYREAIEIEELPVIDEESTLEK